MKTYKFSKKNIKKIPKDPGVYILYSEKDKVNYVGKSNQLRIRLLSYTYTDLAEKTQRMITESDKFSCIRVNSELEALLLEAKLVKKYQPFFNSQLKDDKHPLYIKITNDEYPQVISCRKGQLEDAKKIFGPFPSTTNVRLVLKLLRRIIPFAQHKATSRACLYSQMGFCDPCPSNIEKEKDLKIKKTMRKKYLQNISLIKRTLNGDIKTVRKRLDKKMNDSSKNLDFEKASKYKKQIESLDYITQPKTPVGQFIENPNLYEDQRFEEINELHALILNYMKLVRPKRIECYDVSHLAGASPTASMVTFINAEPVKSLYRHFIIRQEKVQSDTDSLKEIAKRRIKHLPDQVKNQSEWGRPDLIIVDGGKPQLSVFYDKLKEFNIPVIGLAKRFETLVFVKENKGKLQYMEKRVPKGPAKNLLQRLRDESHRFARRLHHKRIRKELFEEQKLCS